MNVFARSSELVSQLTTRATKSIKLHHKYHALALANDSAEIHALADYFQGRYEGFAMARDLVLKTLTEEMSDEV